MKKDLDEKLQDTFAWLKGLELHVDKACEFVKGYTLCENYGFEVGDGWYKLLFDLCIRIEEIYKEYNQPVTIRVVQVKSKFVQLRFYFVLPGKELGIQVFDFMGAGSIRMFPDGE